MPTNTERVVHQRTIEQLRSFCRGELSAVQTYVTALTHPTLAPYAETLRYCLASHQQRANSLASEIERLGGKAPDGSGAWGALTDAIEHAAVGLGRNAALAALQEGEDHGVRDYKADLGKLEPEERKFVETYIIPAQLDTHRTITALKHSIS